MTNILIPTDFSADSFRMAEQAIRFLNREVNVILFHAYEMPFYYQDLFGNEQPPYYKMLNDGFRQGCRQLKSQYPHLVKKINFQYMQGNSNALFRNFAEGNNIKLIVCPDGYAYTKTHARSLNPVPFFKKSRIPMLTDFSLVQKQTAETPVTRLETSLATA